MDRIIEFLNSTSGIIAIASLLIIAFSKTIISIFRMGVTFKSNLASKRDLKEFQEDIRKEMRAYANLIQKNVTDTCLKVIDTRLKNIDGIQDSVTEMQVLKAELESEIKHAFEKYDEIKNIGDSVRALSNKVTRMEYKDNTANTARRTEK